MEILVFLVVLVAAYWAKNNLLNPNTSEAIDDFFRGRVGAVKKSIHSASDGKNESVVEEKEQQVAATSVETNQLPVDKELSSQSKIPQNAVAAVEEAISTYVAKESVETAVKQVPEDSVLNRHFQAQLIAERALITHPYPTDSVLRRHYEANLQSAFNPVPTAQATHVAAKEEVVVQVNSKVEQALPEDSVLKRHVAQLLETKIAA